VEVPLDASWYLTDTAVITATAMSSPMTFSDTAQITSQAYAPPQITISPSVLTSTQSMDEIVAVPVTVSNGHGVTLTYELFPGAQLPGSVGLYHFDEAAGSTTFSDSSGHNNNATCAGILCPAAGESGFIGYALDFDGVDDFLEAPDSLSLNPQQTMAISSWIYPYDWNGNRRIVQKGIHDNQYRFLAESGLFKFHISGVGTVNTSLPSVDEWHHVVGIYDGQAMQIWVDGQLVAESQAGGPIPTTSSPLYIGNKRPDAPVGDHFHGLIDELILFDRALSAEEVQAIYQAGSIYGGAPWLSVEPESGYVPANASQPVTVTLDATGLLPDVYDSALVVLSNDPLAPLRQVPITMTVVPNSNLGWLEGTVKDLRTGSQLYATVSVSGLPLTTTTDAETGFYQLWLEQGTYTVHVNAGDYVSQTRVIDILPLQGTIEDFALLLDAPWLELSSDNVSVSQVVGTVTTYTLAITNSGAADLIFEINQSGLITDRILQLHLDEPDGSTMFYDSSGNFNHGYCQGDSCPTAGVPGISGLAVRFDGIDDFIELPELASGLPEGSISLWFNVDSWNPGFAGMYFWSANSGSSWDWMNLGSHPETGNDYLRFGLYAGGWNWASSGVPPTLGEWHILMTVQRPQEA
jgi:hypothetical protein